MRKMVFKILLALLPAFWTVSGAQNVALSTNLADYAFLGTMNLEASYALAQHWSVNAGMRYNPFTFGSDDSVVQARQQAYALGVRYWPWHIYSGWWLAGKMQYQEYNAGTSKSEYTAEGDRIGSGFAGGYTFMLNPHFNLEVGLGVWAGYDRYVRYECPRCGRIVGEGSQFFLLPDDILLMLSYVF